MSVLCVKPHECSVSSLQMRDIRTPRHEETRRASEARQVRDVRVHLLRQLSDNDATAGQVDQLHDVEDRDEQLRREC